MNNRILAVSLAALMFAGSQAQTVQKVSIGDNMNYGITYSLPMTAVQITVKAHCTKTVAGIYAPYAEKYLGLKDVAQEDSTMCEVEQISMTSVGRADSAHTYHIDFSEKGALPTFYLTEENGLCGINSQPKVVEAPVEKPEAKPTKLKLNPSDVMTSDILKAGSKSKQAELCAQEIFSIRESRSDLIRGEADNTPNDGKQLQLMLDNLTAQEEALLSLFVGNTTESDMEQVYEYLPTAEVKRELIFRFSSELGFVGKDDMAGAPYYISIAMTEDNRMPEMDLKAQKKLEKGIAFCVPGKAHVKLFTAKETLAEGDMQMSQFGHVEQLPQGQFIDKKKPCAALFNSATGAIRVFEQPNEQQ